MDVERTSAHLARVMFFCAAHGEQFHASDAFDTARPVDCWRAVDVWRWVATEVELEQARRVVA